MIITSKHETLTKPLTAASMVSSTIIEVSINWNAGITSHFEAKKQEKINADRFYSGLIDQLISQCVL